MLIEHLSGLDGEQLYNLYSGIIPCAISLGAIGTWWHHVNCTEPGCWKKGHKDPEHGHPRCRAHQEKFKQTA